MVLWSQSLHFLPVTLPEENCHYFHFKVHATFSEHSLKFFAVWTHWGNLCWCHKRLARSKSKEQGFHNPGYNFCHLSMFLWITLYNHSAAPRRVAIQNLSLQVYSFIKTPRKLSGILTDNSQEGTGDHKYLGELKGKISPLTGKNKSYLLISFLKHSKPEWVPYKPTRAIYQAYPQHATY